MPSRTTVTVVKTIQFRTEIVDDTGKVAHGWNHRYRSAHAAAENYTRQRINEWEDKKWDVRTYGAAYHRQTDADHKYVARVKDRFYRLVLKRFKELLADSTPIDILQK